jgi:peroxiredoxin
MAPEQANGEVDRIGPATDVYALGVTLYELLVGVPPLVGTTPLITLQRVVREPPPPLSSRCERVPPDLEAIYQKCLQKDPACRYQRAEDLADDLRRFRLGQPVHARPLARSQPSQPEHPAASGWARFWPPRFVITLAIVVVLLFGVASGVLVATLWFDATLMSIVAPSGVDAGLSSGASRNEASGKAVVGMPAPISWGMTIEGGELSLEDYYKKKVVLLVFWSLGDGNARVLAERTDAITQNARSQPLVIIGVNTDTAKRTTLQERSKSLGITFPSIADESPIGIRCQAFDVHRVPTILLIDVHGTIRHRLEGNVPEQTALQALIQPLLDQANVVLNFRPEAIFGGAIAPSLYPKRVGTSVATATSQPAQTQFDRLAELLGDFADTGPHRHRYQRVYELYRRLIHRRNDLTMLTAYGAK